MMESSISFNSLELGAICPYYIQLNESLQVISCGNALKEYINTTGELFTQYFIVKGLSAGDHHFSVLKQLKQQKIILQSTAAAVFLEGNFTYISQQNQLLFNGDIKEVYQLKFEEYEDSGILHPLQRKKNELINQLEQAKTRINSLLDNVNGHFFEYFFFPDGKEGFRSVRSFLNNTIIAEDEQLHQLETYKSYFTENEFEIFRLQIKKCKESGKPFIFQGSVELPQKSILYYTIKAQYSYTTADGALVYTGVLSDVTNEEEYKRQLLEERRFYLSILDNIPADIVVFGKNHEYLYVNPTSFKDPEIRAWIIGKRDEDYCLYRNKPMRIATERRKLFNEVVNKKSANSFEEKLINPVNGKVEYHLRNMHPLFKENGELNIVIGIGLDITEIKLNELKVKQSEQEKTTLYANLQSMINSSTDAIYAMDTQFRFTAFNDFYKDHFYKLEYGVDPEIGEKNISYQKDSSMYLRLIGYVNQVKADRTVNFRTNYDGKTIDINLHGVYDNQKKLIGYSFYARDITLIERTLQEVKESESKYKFITNNIAEAIVQVYEDGSIFFVNDAWEKITGFSSAEVIGESVFNFFNKRDVYFLIQNFKKIIDDKSDQENYYLPEIRLTCRNNPDGYKWVGINAKRSSVYDNENHKVITATLEDVTELKQNRDAIIEANNKLKEFAQYLQQKIEGERKFLAQEVHDHLGQLITAAKLNISWIEKRLTTSEVVIKDKLTDTIDIMNELVKSVRSIATSIRPSVLDNFGLIAALEQHISELVKRSNAKIKFTFQVDEGELNKNLTADKATALFRICQECLTNSMRYADAEKITVTFSENEKHYKMQIKDDGKGFDINKKTKSLGILGMKERAESIDGELTIYSMPGKGTSVRVQILK